MEFVVNKKSGMVHRKMCTYYRGESENWLEFKSLKGATSASAKIKGTGDNRCSRCFKPPRARRAIVGGRWAGR